MDGWGDKYFRGLSKNATWITLARSLQYAFCSIVSWETTLLPVIDLPTFDRGMDLCTDFMEVCGSALQNPAPTNLTLGQSI